MLLSINLQGLELSTFRGEVPVQPGISAESVRAAGGFAELLGLRSAGPVPALALQPGAGRGGPGGEALPDDGRTLPPGDLLAPDWGIDWPVDPALVSPQIIAPPAGDAATTPVGRDGVADGFQSKASTPLSTAEAADSLRGERLAREALSPAPADSRPIPVLPERFLRADAKQGPATGPNALELENLLSGEGDGSRTPAEALVRRLASEPGGNARPVLSRDGLPQGTAFELPPGTAANAESETGFALSSAAQSDALFKASAASAAENLVVRPGFAPSQASPASPAPAASLPRIDVPLQDPSWGDALNERVTFMSGKDIRNAEIRLNPAELGPIRVQLSVDDRGTSVSFTAHHAQTRDAIEQALPRLRELFSEQGLSLGQASVSDQGVRHERDGQGTEHAEWFSADAEADDAEALPAPGLGRRPADGLVDTFA